MGSPSLLVEGGSPCSREQTGAASRVGQSEQGLAPGPQGEMGDVAGQQLLGSNGFWARKQLLPPAWPGPRPPCTGQVSLPSPGLALPSTGGSGGEVRDSGTTAGSLVRLVISQLPRPLILVTASPVLEAPHQLSDSFKAVSQQLSGLRCPFLGGNVETHLHSNGSF